MKPIKPSYISLVCLSFILAGASAKAGNSSENQNDASKNVLGVTQDQTTILKGIVLDEFGEGLPGALVELQSEPITALTDMQGYFEIRTKTVADQYTLNVSFMGLKPQQVQATLGKEIKVQMEPEHSLLEEVVVTALGIKREQKQLGFSQQTITADEYDNARSNNWSDELKGKVAGLTVISSNSGPMNSSILKLRGDRSINLSANGALVVVDGIIVGGDLWGNGSDNSYIGVDAPVDYGNGIADLNPDDIESISVLKGAGAAALYGSRASNGVLMITTKSGKRNSNGLGISFSSNVSFDVIQKWPDYQYEYGQGAGKSFDKDGNPYYSYGISEHGGNTGSTSSAFGPKFEGQEFYQYDPVTEAQGSAPTLWKPYKNNIKDFWRTGVTTTNTVGLSGGNEKGNVRATISKSKNDWIMPNTGFDRTTVSTKGNYEISKGVVVNTSISYSNRSSDNLPGTGYGNHTIGYFMIFQNPNVDLDWYRPIWKQGYNQTQQIHPFSSYIENPYLIAYETTNSVDANTINGALSTDIEIAPKLTLMLRGTLNSRNDKREERRPYNTSKFGRGAFSTTQINFQEINTDFLLTFNEDTKENFSYSASVGANMLDSRWHSVRASVTGLVTPGVYMLANGIDKPYTVVEDRNKKVNSVYGMASFGYKNMVFVDATLRNDWSSTLEKDNWSFMYPSVNTSLILSDMLNMGSVIDYSKLRFSFARVGNGTDPYQTALYYNNSEFGSSATAPTRLPAKNLKPETTTSYEVGYEHKMFKNRLGLEVSLYKTLSKDQIIVVPLNYATGFANSIMNAGKVENKGIELVLNVTPVKTQDFSWDMILNWATNKNQILSLAKEFEGGDQQVLATSGNAQIIGKVGGTTGDIYGAKFKRNELGEVIYEENGLPVASTDIEYIGSAYADWTAGWVNTFKYKNLTLRMTIDGSYGGIVYSQTHHKMSEQGKLGHTLYGREQGYIIGDGVVANTDGTYSPNTTKVAPADYYKSYYRRANLESNSFDASYIKLRDISVEYSFPKKIINKMGLERLLVSVYGRNLLTLSSFPIFDPETAALNGSSMMPGVEMGQMPSPATYGFNIKLEF